MSLLQWKLSMCVKGSAHFTEVSHIVQQLTIETRNHVSKISTFYTTNKCILQSGNQSDFLAVFRRKFWTTVQICAFVCRAAVKFKFADWNSNKMLNVPSKEDSADGVCARTSAYQGRPDCSSARTGPLTKAQLHRIVTQSNLTEGHRKVCEEPPRVTLPSCCQPHWWGLCWGKFSGMPLRS